MPITSYKFHIGNESTNQLMCVIDAGWFKEHTYELGISLSHLPGNPNEVIFRNGVEPTEAFLLVPRVEIQKRVDELNKDNPEDQEKRWTDEDLIIHITVKEDDVDYSIAIKKMRVVNVYGVANNYPTPNDNQVDLVHLADARYFWKHQHCNSAYNTPFASTGTAVSDYYANLNGTALWDWEEVLDDIIANEQTMVAAADIDSASTLWPSVNPTGMMYNGLTIATSINELLTKAAVSLYATFDGTYSINEPAYVNEVLTTVISEKSGNHIDGGTPVPGYRHGFDFSFMFRMIERKSTDTSPYYVPTTPAVSGSNEITGTRESGDNNTITLEGGIIALMNGSTTPANNSDITTYLSDIINRVYDTYHTGVSDDLVFSGALDLEIDGRWKEQRFYDHGNGLFTRLIDYPTSPPEIPRVLWLEGNFSYYAANSNVVRFELDNALTTSESSETATIDDSSSPINGNSITVYNVETNTAGVYIFYGDSGDAGEAIRDGDNKWRIVNMEGP